MRGHNYPGEAEEMYLLSLAMLIEAGETPPIPIPRLAEALGLQSVSVNQMVHILEEAGVMSYEPYKGVDLTKEGSRRASQVLCRRRLWETFLVRHLGYEPVQAEELACRLEHATTAETASRLAAFLDNPKRSPQGRPIPPCDEAPPPRSRGVLLAGPQAGMQVVILSLPMDGADGSFLRQAGLHPGARIEILAMDEAGNCLIASEAGHHVHLAGVLGREIWVDPVEDSGRGSRPKGRKR